MHSDKKHGLGKGMSTLMGNFDYDASLENVINTSILPLKETKENEVLSVSLFHVKPNPNQPRKSFDEDKLQELADSIRTQGIIQPILVEEYAPERYSIIAGERRYRAAELAGLSEIPVIVRSLSPIQRAEIALIENVQREDLNPMEEAAAYHTLMETAGYTQEDIALRVGKSRSAVANTLRLLVLPDSIKDDVTSGLITPGHARAILSLKNPSDYELLRKRIVEDGLTVREAESLAGEYNAGHKVVPKGKKKEKSSEVVLAEEKFISALGAKVEIKGSVDRGRIQIRFRTQRELERIYALLADDDLFEE